MTRTFVGLNIRVIEVNLVFLDSRKGIVEIRQTRTDGFDFRSLQFDARLDFFENLIVVERAAIGSDLGGHMYYRERNSLDFGDRFGLKLIREFAVNNLFQRDVGVRHPRSYFDEG